MAFPERSTVFANEDNSLPLLPGIYMGIPDDLRACPVYRYGFYMRIFDNVVLKDYAPHNRCRYLFSFVGRSANAPAVRRAVLGLRCDRALLRDSWSGQHDGDAAYSSILQESKFVICPRGIGPSTWRVFEAMRTGRSPVIISDEWCPPPGPRWEEFAVIVPESRVSDIPERLLALEPRAEEMGFRAWEEWQRNFSLDTAFTWIGDTLERVQESRDACRPVIHRRRLREALSSRLHHRSFPKECLREICVRLTRRIA
jgi:hypothetical protein